MSATLIVRHPVQDYTAWRAVFDGPDVAALHQKYGVSNARVAQAVEDANDVLVSHDFASLSDAEGFAGDPGLKQAMETAGVAGAPRIEIFELV
jgi:hypothetical protein